MENTSRSEAANQEPRRSDFAALSPTSRRGEPRTATVGSRRSRPEGWLLAVIALLTLVASACSATTETNTAGTDFVQHTPPTESFSDTDSNDTSSSDRETGVDQEPLVKLPTDTGDTETGDTKGGLSTMPGSAVLAAALAQAEEQSYSFDMGMEMVVSMMGMEMEMAPTGPIMSGSVSDDRMHAVMDLGEVMAGTTMTDEFGRPVSVPELGDLGDLRVEMWLDGTVVTVDMSAMAGLDPSITGPVADGPVSFDLLAIDDVDVDDITAEMLGGQQSLDPSSAAELLRNLDTVVEVGTDDVSGRAVTVYRGVVSMAEYSEIMGEDASDFGGDLFGMGDLGAIGAGFDEMTVELTVMIDDDDLLRRLEVHLDMGPLFQNLFTAEQWAGEPTADSELDDALAEAMMSMFDDLTMTMDLWMEFDGYGETVVEPAPPAVDLTAEFDSVFAGITA